MAQANVTFLRLHWHNVTDGRADVVVMSETRLTVVSQKAFWRAPWESQGGGCIWDAPAMEGG